MTQNELSLKYFNWMYDLVCDGRRSYKKLLAYLHVVEFTYTIPFDDNRAADGINLRYHFAYENDYNQAMVAAYLDDKPCSVLEMMVALVRRCEEETTDDPEFGNRTGFWFRCMLRSLGIDNMTDSYFDEFLVSQAIGRFLNREYAPNGKGGLFTVNNYRRDMRRVEIWNQMHWFLDEVL